MVIVTGPKKQPIPNVNVFEVTESCASGKTPQQAIDQCAIEYATTNANGVATLAYPSSTQSYQFCANVNGVAQCTRPFTPNPHQGCNSNKSFTLVFKTVF